MLQASGSYVTVYVAQSHNIAGNQSGLPSFSHRLHPVAVGCRLHAHCLIFSIFLVFQVEFLIDISIYRTDTIKKKLFQEATKIVFIYIHIIYKSIYSVKKQSTSRKYFHI